MTPVEFPSVLPAIAFILLTAWSKHPWVCVFIVVGLVALNLLRFHRR